MRVKSNKNTIYILGPASKDALLMAKFIPDVSQYVGLTKFAAQRPSHREHNPLYGWQDTHNEFCILIGPELEPLSGPNV